MNATYALIGSYTVNSKTRRLSVVQNPNGTWTASGHLEMRDFCRRGDAVRWLKRIYAKPGVQMTWYE